MDRLSPEILHMVCNYLSGSDICNFRLANRTLAHFGECYLIPDVRFYLHGEELRRLRGIAGHKVLAQHVKSLTYSCDLLDAQDQQHLVSFAWSYAATHCAGRVRDLYDGTELKKFVMDLYRAYEADVQAQEDIIRTEADIQCLKEVLPSFTSVRRIAIHANLAHNDSLDQPATLPSAYTQSKRHGKKLAIEQLGGHFMDHLHPLGCRHTESVLSGLTDAHAATLQSFYAGSLSWRFFDRDAAEVVQLLRPLRNIKHLELVIESALDPHFSLRESVAQCRRVMGSRRGHPLREALKSMRRLTTLKISFAHSRSGSGDTDSPPLAADLADVLEPGYRWENLRELHLQGVDASRHALVDILQRHRGSLEKLSLEDCGLQNTSWHRFLPDVRRHTILRDFQVSGVLQGRSEEDAAAAAADHHIRTTQSSLAGPKKGLLPLSERWCLPRDGDKYVDYPSLVLKESINDYCRLGGQLYSGECPILTCPALTTAAPTTMMATTTTTTTTMVASMTAAPGHPIDMPATRHWVGKEILV
ncbi:F-box/TPR repeat protein Pof3 [Microdochium nivale]|nr:F-box/TPR repeat protein Pof3 [Microdochium nivale]